MSDQEQSTLTGDGLENRVRNMIHDLRGGFLSFAYTYSDLADVLERLLADRERPSMSATAMHNERPVIFDGQDWLYQDTGESIYAMKRHRLAPPKCCEIGTYGCQVPMAAGGRRVEVDICIADIVAALNAANIKTVASCCGHGRVNAGVILEDGRRLWWATVVDGPEVER